MMKLNGKLKARLVAARDQLRDVLDADSAAQKELDAVQQQLGQSSDSASRNGEGQTPPSLRNASILDLDITWQPAIREPQ